MQTSAVLLCSGTSSRMKPLSDKFFFEYLGKPILQWQMENLLQQKNISQIFIVGNEKNLPEIQKFCDENFPKEQKKICFCEQKILSDGMKGGILSVENFFNFDNSLLVMSSNDIVENWFLEYFLDEKTFPQSSIKICGKVVEKYFPGGYLSVDCEKNITAIVEKPGEGFEPSNLINLVFHWFQNPKKLFAELKNQDNQTDDAYEKTLQTLFETEKNAKAVEYSGRWQSLKYPFHHLDMTDFFLSQITEQKISKEAFVSEKASIIGNVVVEEGVKIFDFAVIQGPCFIGKNSIIGNHCLVRHSHIGENCCIGQGTEVARSYLRNTVFTHQSYIGDSVVDSDVNFGAGCRTGNLRHDCGEIEILVKNQRVKSGKTKLGIFCGKGCRFGINTSFAPGISIGENSWTFPHLFLAQNIPENSFLKPKKEALEYERKENRCERNVEK